jgi:hypothetical protein
MSFGMGAVTPMIGLVMVIQPATAGFQDLSSQMSHGTWSGFVPHIQ